MADPISVLIVDDIPETRDHLTKLLGFESDIEVVGAADVRSPRRSTMAAQLRPDVVLMDINMPDMDGIAATEQLVGRRPDRGRRDDVGPGRGGLPPPLDARRRARVPGQAVQQRRADRLDPAGLHPRAREAEPDGGLAGRRRPPAAHAAGRPRARPGRRGLQPQGRRRPDDRRGQPRRRGRHGARQAVGRRRRLVPVRRRRGPAQPESEEQVDRGPRPRARGRRGARVDRHVRDQPLLGRPGPPRAALAGDGRADHPGGDPEGPRGAPARRTTSSSSTAPRRSTRRPWRSSTPPT